MLVKERLNKDVDIQVQAKGDGYASIIIINRAGTYRSGKRIVKFKINKEQILNIYEEIKVLRSGIINEGSTTCGGSITDEYNSLERGYVVDQVSGEMEIKVFNISHSNIIIFSVKDNKALEGLTALQDGIELNHLAIEKLNRMFKRAQHYMIDENMSFGETSTKVKLYNASKAV